MQIAAIRADGYVVIPDLLSADELLGMRRALQPALDAGLRGRNNFEGFETQRVYSLVGIDKLFEDLVENPRVLTLCDAFLQPNYLLTASQAINIRPGETPQPFHSDDSFYTIPRPRPAISLSTIVAVDAFTETNGATQVIAQSHTWDDAALGGGIKSIDFTTAVGEARRPRPAGPLPEAQRARVIDVTIPAGAAIVFLGTLVHRGGENRSSRPRLALSNQYCEPWARQQENYALSIPREKARAMSVRVQELLGYSVHPPFMGHANGVHPRRWLA